MIICQASTSSSNVTITVANASGSASTTSSTVNLQGAWGAGGEGTSLQSSCASALTQILGISLAAAAVMLVAMVVGCVDGPFALVTCGVAALFSGAVGTAVGEFNKQKFASSGCPGS